MIGSGRRGVEGMTEVEESLTRLSGDILALRFPPLSNSPYQNNLSPSNEVTTRRRTVLAALSASHLPLQDLNRGLYTRQRLCTGNSGFGLENVWGRMTRHQRRANIAAACVNDDAAFATSLSKSDYGSRTT